MVVSIIRSVTALVVGFGGALASFGFLLAVLWSPEFSANVFYKVITTVLATGTALVFSGAISGLVNGRYPLRMGLLSGFFAGLLAFGYIFGPDFRLLLALPAAGLLGGLGGLIVIKTKYTVQWRKI